MGHRRLNGWQRLGVLASLAWLPFGTLAGLDLGNRALYWTGNIVQAWSELLACIVLPIIAGWLTAYLGIALFRWVSRGFTG